MKGFHQDDEEMQREWIYWFFARKFGYTPEQTDEIPYDRIVYLVEMEKEAIKKENQVK